MSVTGRMSVFDLHLLDEVNAAALLLRVAHRKQLVQGSLEVVLLLEWTPGVGIGVRSHHVDGVEAGAVQMAKLVPQADGGEAELVVGVDVHGTGHEPILVSRLVRVDPRGSRRPTSRR